MISELKKARSAAYKMLAVKDRTEKSIRDTLLKNGIAPEMAAAVIIELTEAGYLNDRRYAQRFIDTRTSGSKPYGPLWIQSALHRAGVEPDAINDCFSVFFTAEKEAELAAVYLQKILEKEHPDIQKAMRKLLARGFHIQAAKHALIGMNQRLQ